VLRDELIHTDIKGRKLNRIGHRITGDRVGQGKTRGIDHSRLAYSDVLPNEKRRFYVRFLFNVLRFFRTQGTGVQRVTTDNGPTSWEAS
jgi:hypothetical protein